MINSKNKILVLDFGSQTTQLIARRIRELGVYSEIRPYFVSLKEIKSFSPSGIIFSGSPSSVYDKNAPLINKKIFNIGVPILGICYGAQLISHLLGGKVEKSKKREYGLSYIEILERNKLFKGLRKNKI